MSNGGGWQGSTECSRDYETKYNYIEYKKYGESGSGEDNTVAFEFDEAPAGWTLGDAVISDGALNVSNGQVVTTDIVAGAAKYAFELDVPEVPAGIEAGVEATMVIPAEELMVFVEDKKEQK